MPPPSEGLVEAAPSRQKAGAGLGGDPGDGLVTFAVRMLPGVAKLLRLQAATKPFKAGLWGQGATGGWVSLRPLDVTEVGTRPHRPTGLRQGGREDLKRPSQQGSCSRLWFRHVGQTLVQRGWSPLASGVPSCSPLCGLGEEEP